MTTAITTVYDALVTRIGTTLLSGHKRLPHAYSVGQNPDTHLEKGWALAVREGTNTNRQIGQRASVGRNFDVIITRKFKARELDPTKKADTEKDLLEDLQLVIDSFESNTDLDSVTGTHIVKYLGDSGIERVRDEQDAFLAITVNVNVEYFRTLS